MKNKIHYIQKAEKTKTEIEKINEEYIKQIDKLDNKTNTFFSISLVILSIQISLLSGTYINLFEEYLKKQQIFIILIIVLYISIIILNLKGIFNFRKSLKMSD